VIRNAVVYSASGTPKALTAAAQKSPMAAIAAAAKAKGFVWIGLEDPDEPEMRTLADQLGLHPLATIDAITGKQQPKIQSFDEHLFIVMWILRETSKKKLEVGSLFLFVRDGLLVTVQRDMGKHPLVIEDILEATETSLRAGAVGGMSG
jgi:magnesium transporter